jgi:hypothetical protein
LGEAAEEGTGEAATDGIREASGPILADATEAATEEQTEGVAEKPAAEALTADPALAEKSVFDKSVVGIVDRETTKDAPAVEEEAAEGAEDTQASKPVGSEVAVAEPGATVAPRKHGVWTDEQAAAFRARLREATANVVDKAAGAVIETVNTVAGVIRSRTSSNRRSDDRRS